MMLSGDLSEEKGTRRTAAGCNMKIGLPAPTRGFPMNEQERNLRIAESLHRDSAWQGRTFQRGDFVALLGGEIVAVEKTADDAIAALRSRDPDPDRGMVIEVTSPVVDVIRGTR
ncbi:MAG: hypothetical protein J2P46_06980 [Zavarzinella sp.]|nr:hypothetical protein [Zavarzinella sp.]